MAKIIRSGDVVLGTIEQLLVALGNIERFGTRAAGPWLLPDSLVWRRHIESLRLCQ